MPDWIGYRLSLQLASPVHCGWRTVGNLKQTRPFVPGPAIWGALASRLARDFLKQDYHQAERAVDDQLRFTYLYPSDPAHPRMLWPWDADQSEFDWTYLHSYMSTALVGGHTSRDGSLHEIEYIAPITRDGNPVYLSGYVWRQEAFPEDRLLRLWSTVQLGGERTYGFGRVAKAELNLITDPIFGCYAVEPEVVLTSEDSQPIFAHVETHSEIPSMSKVRVEPLVGRRIDPAGRFTLTAAQAAYCPGTYGPPGAKWQIGPRGLWRAV